jgi:hypothetical protein
MPGASPTLGRGRPDISNNRGGPNTVIASEAKQSISPSKERMDCFVASLLAMTSDTVPRSRRSFRARFARNFAPSAIRGRGECRMPDAPAASCAHIGSEYAHEYSQRATGITRHSRTQWFTAYFVISPATGFLATVVMRIKSTNLMPASGHQDHTTSPSAGKAPSSEAPPASIASRLAFVTIASRPSVRRDGVILPLIWGRDQQRRLRQINTTGKSRAHSVVYFVNPQIWWDRERPFICTQFSLPPPNQQTVIELR